jgi:hypothetical protein
MELAPYEWRERNAGALRDRPKSIISGREWIVKSESEGR